MSWGNTFYKRFEWWIFRTKRKLRLTNKNVTILSSNCNGGYIYHDLGLRFNSPTINLYIEFPDFIKFLKNIDHYLSTELEENNEFSLDYPVGQLDDINIFFVHYDSFADAKYKWELRSRRINRNNLFIIATDRDKCTDELITEFDSLPFKNKIICTHKDFSNLSSSFYFPEFSEMSEVGILSDFIEGKRLRRYLDQIDYVKLINEIKM